MKSGNTEWAPNEEVIDLHDLYARVMYRKWWVLTSIILFSSAFALAAFLITPVYQSATVLVPAGAGKGGAGSGLAGALGQLGGLASLAGAGLSGGGDDVEEAIAVLKSREFTDRFIVDLNLMPELFADKWDDKNSQWKVDEKKQPTPGKAYRVFDEKIRFVSQDRKTRLVTVQVRWRDRNKAALWANELVKRLNSKMRERAIAQASASVGYLEKELTATPELETREAINRLIEAQIKQRMLANVTEDYVFRVVDKAVPADIDDLFSPRRALMVISGLLIGLLFGVAIALISGKSGNSGR